MELFVTEKTGAAIQHAIDTVFAAGGGKVIAAGQLGKLKTVFQMSSTIALMLTAAAVSIGIFYLKGGGAK